MDSITHIVIGAAQGELLAGKKLGKKAMLWGAIANSLPDIDVLTQPFLSVPDGLLAHHGLTHSILFAVVMPPLLGYLFSRWKYTRRINFQQWTLIFTFGLFTHIFIDALNGYGTGWYEPFSHRRISFNTIFVADPFFTFPLLISFVVLLILKKDSPARKQWAKWGLLLSCCYLLFTFYNKYKVDKIWRKNIAEQQITCTDYFTTPTPLNNFLWYGVIKEDKQFQIGYYSIFDHDEKISFYSVPSNDSLISKFWNEKALQKLIRFSEGYYCITKDSAGSLEFNDLRFGQIGGWTNPSADFIFSYHLSHSGSGEAIISSGRFKLFGKDPLKGLIERIKGEKKES